MYVAQVTQDLRAKGGVRSRGRHLKGGEGRHWHARRHSVGGPAGLLLLLPHKNGTHTVFSMVRHSMTSGTNQYGSARYWINGSAAMASFTCLSGIHLAWVKHGASLLSRWGMGAGGNRNTINGRHDNDQRIKPRAASIGNWGVARGRETRLAANDAAPPPPTPLRAHRRGAKMLLPGTAPHLHALLHQKRGERAFLQEE